ncbi:MAG: type II secretion system protein GspK [Sulfurovum sp.]|nr:type II secretion system protein GspK [Sulfurovum sp.]
MIQVSDTRKGFALSIVLWIVAGLLLGIAYIGSLSKENLHLNRMLQDKLASQIMAENYLQALKFYMATADYDSQKLVNRLNEPKLPEEIYLDGRTYVLGDVTVSLRDFSGMLSPAVLYKSLTQPSQRELRFTIRDSLADWLDTDNVVRLNGAERAYYRLQQGAAYQPANMPFLQSLDELRLIKGIRDIDPKKWSSWKKQIAYRPKGVNYMLVGADYLSALLGISLDEAKVLVELREKDKVAFGSTVRRYAGFNDDILDMRISKRVKIIITAKKGLSKSRLEVTLDYNGINQKLFTVSDYRVY